MYYEVNTIISILGKKKKERKAVKWVLKAKPSDSDSWEDIQEFDEPKTYSELRDLIDELRSEGYEGVRLDAYDKEGRFVKHEFVRMFGLGKAIGSYKAVQKALTDMLAQQMTLINETLRTQTELMKQVAELKKTLTEEKPTFVDAIAQVMYLKELEKTLAETLGITHNQVATNPQLQMFIMEIAKDLLKKYLPEIEKRFKERFAETPPTPTPTPPTPTMTLPLPTPTLTTPPKIEIPEDIEERLNKIAEEVEKKIEPPCMKEGTCEEEEVVET